MATAPARRVIPTNNSTTDSIRLTLTLSVYRFLHNFHQIKSNSLYRSHKSHSPYPRPHNNCPLSSIHSFHSSGRDTSRCSTTRWSTCSLHSLFCSPTPRRTARPIVLRLKSPLAPPTWASCSHRSSSSPLVSPIFSPDHPRSSKVSSLED